MEYYLILEDVLNEEGEEEGDEKYKDVRIQKRFKRIYGGQHQAFKNFHSDQRGDDGKNNNEFWFKKFKSAYENREARRRDLGIDHNQDENMSKYTDALQKLKSLKGVSNITNITAKGVSGMANLTKVVTQKVNHKDTFSKTIEKLEES